MDRTDFIETRTDVIKNIYTLYSYTLSDENEREWALERFMKGKCFIVEPFGNTLMFSPSRFSGYKDNTWQKHCEMRGDGTQTNDNFRNLKLYKDVEDPWLTMKFDEFLKRFDLQRNEPKFFIPANMNLNDLESERHCFFISPTHCNGQKETAWKSFRDNGIAAIGWENDDYSNAPIEDIKEIYADQPKAAEAFGLMKLIKEGDIICCTNNNRGLWGIGIATSRYKYDENIHYAGKDDNDEDSFYSHYVEVAWLCFKEQGYILTAELNISPTEKQWQPYGTLTRKEIPDYINNYLLKLNPWDMEKHYKYEHYINLLKANKNLILTGAPGTGKTYLAKAISEEMNAETGFVQFHPSYDYTDFVEGLRPTPPDKNGNIGFERKDGVFKEFCKKALGWAQATQHISNSTKTYLSDSELDDAIKWFRDTMNGKTIGSIRDNTPFTIIISEKSIKARPSSNNEFNIASGVLKKYLQTGIYDSRHYTYEPSVGQYILKNYPRPTKSTPATDTPFVFIIDEINRGEISKIFGELFFSIDPGYRGKKGKVKTQYQNLITDKSDPFYDGFFVPDNVYLIGTMNDIDRSVESIDFAMRRRFAWQEIIAADNTEMLDVLGDLKEEVITKMNNLNNAIWNSATGNGIEGLNNAYHIGGAYFCKLTHYLDENQSNVDEAYRLLWDNHLRGVLFEYLRGSVDAMENLKCLRIFSLKQTPMLCLNDNTPYSVKADELCAYDALRAIANRPVKDIVDSHGNNLLIYPHSFRQSKDKIGSQSILSWQTNWKGGKCDGADLSTGNVVGFIGIDDCDITIKSRFSENTGEDYFLHYMLQKALCINIFNLSHSSRPETLFDFLLFLFPKHLNEALMQGIYKDYRHNSYNDANIRGVIDINRHINANIPFNGRVAYHTRELSYDNRVTQLIRHTIEHIATTDIGKKLLENEAETHASVSRIIAATPGYRRQDRSKIIKDNLKPLSHPYYTRYKPLQQICMRILNHDRLKYGPNGDRIYGILFDISYLWEEYLFTLLRPLGFKHPDNRSNRGGIYLSECNHFIRFPDFYDSETVIDAKYKVSIDTRNDINQMLTYMYTLKSRHGVIIQPAVDCTQIQPFRLNGHGKDHGATLYISSLRIPRAAVNYNAFKAAIKTSENEFKTILTSVFRESDMSLP